MSSPDHIYTFFSLFVILAKKGSNFGPAFKKAFRGEEHDAGTDKEQGKQPSQLHLNIITVQIDCILNTVILYLQSINLKPVVAKRPNVMGGPRTNLQVAAILERANAIRQVDHLASSCVHIATNFS
jgi:hypothetical protein